MVASGTATMRSESDSPLSTPSCVSKASPCSAEKRSINSAPE